MIGEKILGFVWEGEYNGLVELNLTDNSIVQIISLDEIKACVEKVGDIYDVTDYIRNPKYYKDGYTFDFGGEIYFFHKEGECQAKIIIDDECRVDNYHMYSDDQILIEGCYRVGEDGRSKVSMCDTSSEKEEIIFDNEPVGMGDNNGLMDVSKDGKLIAYYEKNIYLYITEKPAKGSMWQDRKCVTVIYWI